MTKNDILVYLNISRKAISDDPSQRWIGTYNGRQMILLKFFRWLYNPDEPDQRRRVTPPCMQGIKRLPRKEKIRYKASDIWEAREHAMFLKYCPDKRDRCYHAMANDMSARPHEILGVKISDIKFNEYQKAKHLLDIMISLSFSPMLVHKLIVEMSLDEDSYDLIGGKPWKGNLGVLQNERFRQSMPCINTK
jgi:hypothetical protein